MVAKGIGERVKDVIQENAVGEAKPPVRRDLDRATPDLDAPRASRLAEGKANVFQQEQRLMRVARPSFACFGLDLLGGGHVED